MPNHDAEKLYASQRAKQLWGDGAWVLNQSTLNQKMFIVSSGKGDGVPHYGEGESWDEAFEAAGSSLFQAQVKEVLNNLRTGQYSTRQEAV
jgi:hypothetical protein